MLKVTWLRSLAPCVLLGTLAACSSNSSTIGPTTTPASTTIEFTGTLNAGGATSYPFAGLAAGQVSAELLSLNPGTDAAGNNLTVGLQLGVWDGSACQGVVSNDKLIVFTTVVATATQAGNLCMRIYDATSTLPAAVNYDILVTHP
jgi:hypothetical protein